MSLIFEAIIFFLTEGAKKDALFGAICGLDSEVERLKTKLSSVSGQLY